MNGIPVDYENETMLLTGGYQRSPKYYISHGYWHSAVDIAGRRGSEIYATHDGKVTIGKGNTIHIVDMANTLMTVYAHCVLNVTTGQEVKAGDVIGYMSDGGGAQFVHLHYEIQIRSSGETDNTPLELNYPEWEYFKSPQNNSLDHFPGSVFSAKGWRPINPLDGDDLLVIPDGQEKPFDPTRIITPQMVYKKLEEMKHLTEGTRNIYNRNAVYDFLKSIFFGR